MKTAALLALCLLGSGPVWADARPSGELTVALSSFATEVLDPVLGGDGVKFYLALIFDHLIGVTPDGQLSRDLGIATAWEPSADHKRWTFTLRRGVLFHNGDELTEIGVKVEFTVIGQFRLQYRGLIATLTPIFDATLTPIFSPAERERERPSAPAPEG